MTEITGQIKVHKTDNQVRNVYKAKILDSGGLAVWDGEDSDEPDIIVSADMWRRVERDGHSWLRSGHNAILEEAKERDDVNEELIKNHL